MATKVQDGKLIVTKTVEEALDGDALSQKRLHLAQQKAVHKRKIQQHQAKIKQINAALKEIKAMIKDAKSGGVKVPTIPTPPAEGGVEPSVEDTQRMIDELDADVKAEIMSDTVVDDEK